ncbi:MAG TPA: DUF2062 domain-containing protein [bacterium]
MDGTRGTRLKLTMTSRAYRLLLLHPVRLVRRLLAEHATPRSLAAAAALGMFVGALPVIGLHTLLVYALARRLRLNRLMALGANQLGMPPFVPALCIETGYYLRHGEFLTEISMRTLGREALDRFWEWLIGAFTLGPVLALTVGGAIWMLAALVQRRGAGDADGGPGAGAEGESGKATTAGQP